jgi:hypothetical protein
VYHNAGSLINALLGRVRTLPVVAVPAVRSALGVATSTSEVRLITGAEAEADEAAEGLAELAVLVLVFSSP